MSPRQRQAANDEDALDLRALFERHYASIWRLLGRLGVPGADLDDATQEVFWVAARRIEDIQPGSEHAFLYGVALRVASDARRRLSTSHPVQPVHETPNLQTLQLDPEQELQAHQARQLLSLALDHMPEEQRSVFVLHELEDLEVQTIASMQAIPVGTASSRLRRARQTFAAVCRRLRIARERMDG